MSFRDEMKQKANSRNEVNNATTYRDQCVANYNADIEKTTNTIISMIKNGFKEARINPSYFKYTLGLTTEKHKKNAVFCLSIRTLNCAKYEKRICLKTDDRGCYYLISDKNAMLKIYATVAQFCIQNDIANFKNSYDRDRWPCVSYIDKHWIRDSGLDTSGINYHDDNPWAMLFYLIMFL